MPRFKHQRNWSDHPEDVEILKIIYPDGSWPEILKVLPYTRKQIVNKAFRVGIKRSSHARGYQGSNPNQAASKKTALQHHHELLKKYGQCCLYCGTWLTHVSFATGHGKCVRCLEITEFIGRGNNENDSTRTL